MSSPVEDLRAAVAAAIATLRDDGAPAPAFALERPKRAEHGDYATNAAMLLAPKLGKPPREIAESLGAALGEQLGDRLEGTEVAGPGFLNVRLGDRWYREAVAGVLTAGDGFGRGTPDVQERILVEFVSANPTGPMHVGHARNAAYGDAIGRLLEFAGHAVEREYYLNDYGTQVVKFGESLQKRARGEDIPKDNEEGLYPGEYVIELATEITDAATRDVLEVARIGVELMRARIDLSLRRFGIVMDTWFSERSLHEGDPSEVDQAFAKLDELGESYRADGALWLRTTKHTDDKDRVLERSSGEHTYFASDTAYHQHKRARGFDRQINVWGADHHGYVQRTKAAYAALGGDPDELELLIMQFVHLKGQAMSKRGDTIVTLDELVDLIGVDAARWFLLNRSHDTTIDLDLDLASEQSAENPVYYVQYAHARIASILAKAGEPAVDAALASDTWGSAPLEPAERELVRKLLAFGDEVADAAERRVPHRITTYALELAQTFTAFYRDCQVVGAEGEGVEAFRLALSSVSKQTLARALELVGVSAPESMHRDEVVT